MGHKTDLFREPGRPEAPVPGKKNGNAGDSSVRHLPRPDANHRRKDTEANPQSGKGE